MRDTLKPAMEFSDRLRIAEAIQTCRTAVAEQVTSEFLARHPEWQTRYGERARQHGIEDAGYHLDFLAAAIESGERESFGDYAEWAVRMLQARHIEPEFLAENLNQIGRSLRDRLPAQDAGIVDSFIASGVERCFHHSSETASAPDGHLGQLTRMYTDAVIKGSRQAALNLVLEAVRQGYPVIEIYSEVLQAAMYRIGQLWEENKIAVAREHMATAITQFVIAHLYPLIEKTKMSLGKAVITGVAGELHQVGANMVADVLEASGWDVRFLGTNTPVNGVLDAIEQHGAGILGISATMLFNISSVSRLVNSVRARSGSRIRILVGGGAFRTAPSLYREIGADACGLDLQSAVALARSFRTKNGTATGTCVLIIDDDPGIRTFLRFVLEKAGYQVMEAENGKEAMHLLGGHSFDLILIDLVMPEQEGLETIPQIKAGFPATRIIAMSGFEETFLRAARALGASETLKKPVTPTILLTAIEHVLSA